MARIRQNRPARVTSIWLLLAISGVATAWAAGDEPRPQVTIQRVDRPPVIDDFLDMEPPDDLAQQLSRTRVRRQLDVPESWDAGLVAVSFGAIQEHKRVDRVLRGLALARERGADARLVLAGELRTERLDVSGLVTELGLDEHVRITGWLEERTGHDWLHAADVCVNLRGPSTGGTSGGIFQALGACRGVIASDRDEQRELPDACVLRVPVGDGEIEALAAHLAALHADPEVRVRLEAAARAFVDEQCHWSHVAARYAELLAAFPAHRTNRKSLIKTAIEGADRARAEG